jgi:hypothetical protein
MSKTFSAMTVALMCALAATAGAAPARPRASPVAVIPLEPYLDADHWAFRGKIGDAEGLFQLDTGGGLTVVTPAATRAVGCKPWGRFSGFRMRGDRLDLQRCERVSIDLGGITLQVPSAGVWDLSSVLPKGAPALSASVGLDAFAGRAVTLDLPHRQLIVESPESLRARTAAAHEVPVHFVHEVEGYGLDAMIGLDTADGRVWMTLDSGNDAPITVGRHIAALLGLDPDGKGPQHLAAPVAPGVSLEGTAIVRDLILDGNIGSPILSRWAVTLDLVRGRAWIAPAAVN